MKKILITILLLTMVVLSACSAIQTYLPKGQNQDNQSQNDSLFEDSFNLTDDVEIIDLTEDEDEVVEEEIIEEEVVEEQPLPENSYVATIEVTEGDLVNLGDLQAQDPDGDVITYSFSAPLSSSGMWLTQDGDEGTYEVEVTASDGLLSTTETVQLIVNPSNKGPVIDCPGSFAVKEGSDVEIPCTIYDKEGDELSYVVSGFADDLSFTTSYDDAGTHSLTVVATDGNRESTKTISLIVSNVNRRPTVDAMDDVMVLEGETVELSVSASDEDGDGLTVTYPLLFDEDGRWSTEKGDAGTYELEIVVSDGEDEVTTPVNIVVEKVNSAPTLSLQESVTVNEGETIDLDISAADEDGDQVTVTIEGFMTSETYTTTYDDAGEYEVVVTVDDGKAQTSKTVSVTVTDVNRPPVFIFN